MSTYAIGDLQGCYEPLQRLLEKIEFDPAKDKLWFAGDLINRGPDSLKTLRFVKSLGDSAISVLGNHDLHMMAVYYGSKKPKNSDTFQDILAADDCDELMNWLRTLPLVHYDKSINTVMSHAGIPPKWSAKKSLKRATEVHEMLTSGDYVSFFENMYGNKQWKKSLEGNDRYRAIVNFFTRMRFCDASSHLDFEHKTTDSPDGYLPWYMWPDRKAENTRIVFGHWAALEGKTYTDNVFALDTGCVWGGKLSALRLEDEKWFRVSAKKKS